MSRYYYLAASLPPLSFTGDLPITYKEVKDRLEANLQPEDLRELQKIRLYTDIENLKAKWQEAPIDFRGNLQEKELDDALLGGVFFPEYVFEFLAKYETVEQRMRHFSAMLSQFFLDMGNSTGFVRDFFAFERQWRLIALAFRAKRLKRDIFKELQFEDLTDPLVVQILSQKDAPEYEPPEEYKQMKELFAPGIDPWEQNEALAKFRFEKIRDMQENRTPFCLDTILSYLAALVLLEQRRELDAEKGKVILDTFKTN